MSKYQTESLFAAEETDQRACNHIIRVAFESAADAEFDYLVPDEIWPVGAGQRVEAPFGKADKAEKGFCVEADVPFEESFAAHGRGRKLKIVSKIIDKEPLVDSGLMELAKWISSYYVCPLGQVLAAMVPGAVKKGAGVRIQRQVYIAGGIEEEVKKLRGKKQKQIIKLLQERKAFSSDSALELRGLLAEVGCTDAPIKKLAEKQIIKIAEKTILKSLPAIPEGMAIKTEKVILNEDQENALAHIIAEIDSEEFGVTLLYGVTDSGKTELYIRAIEVCLQKGKAAIVLLPEIALTTQTVQRFNSRF